MTGTRLDFSSKVSHCIADLHAAIMQSRAPRTSLFFFYAFSVEPNMQRQNKTYQSFSAGIKKKNSFFLFFFFFRVALSLQGVEHRSPCLVSWSQLLFCRRFGFFFLFFFYDRHSLRIIALLFSNHDWGDIRGPRCDAPAQTTPILHKTDFPASNTLQAPPPHPQ